ncbi:hypothetical protein GCWU000324_01275 [Kingella oralis ATCC 51147]|jgi:hypothetical protein|uniref:Uncharacterized protein n=1 Tax=Kingella oralis ATCC 51147 TaxID=629741 RepID=C4GGK7_9NEIS|nr:hypothetical protein GCWU000324_01275 [Kingella oralis ATCC 51147]
MGGAGDAFKQSGSLKREIRFQAAFGARIAAFEITQSIWKWL